MSEHLHGINSRVSIKRDTEIITDTQVSDTICLKYMKQKYNGMKFRIMLLTKSLKGKENRLNLKTVYADHFGKTETILNGMKSQKTEIKLQFLNNWPFCLLMINNVLEL